MAFQEYFKTPVYMENLSHWTDDINKKCEKHLNQIKQSKKYKERVKKKNSDFGEVAHSYEIATDPELKFYIDHIGQRSWEFLDGMGFDLSNHTCVFTECWVQEFPKKGAGHHTLHTHWNGHISGFYFLKASEATSMPLFEDPRPGHLMNGLPEADKEKISYASTQINYKVKPGRMIFFPSYMPHQYVVDMGYEPFRFIHFNCQAIPKGVLNG